MTLAGEHHRVSDEGSGIIAQVSSNLGRWLKENQTCILVTSYQSGRLFILGADDRGKIHLQQHLFDRAMGVAAFVGGFVFGSLHQIWRFRLIKPSSENKADDLHLLIPQNCHYSGFVNCHDVEQLKGQNIVYAATLFNCIAGIGKNSNFIPVWHPPFIDGFAPEDRCHLNGLAATNGILRFVSMLGVNNQKMGWRLDRSQGAIFDIKTNAAVASGLWMSHSPRVHKGKLYALESGRGSFGVVSGGRISELLMVPGFARGLDFLDDVAAIGFSRPRPSSIEGLPLANRVRDSGVEPSCGVVFYDQVSSTVLHSIQFTSGVEEIYDVAFLTGAANPRLIHPNSQEMIKTYSVGIEPLPQS